MLSALAKLKRPSRPALGREHRVPRGRTVYAIGDIHGRSDLLDALMAKISQDIDAAPDRRAVLVFLGDYIDRGPDSAGVLDRLAAMQASGAPEAYFILGNHEEALLRLLAGEEGLFDDWLRFGGLACLESYGVAVDDVGALRASFSSEWLRGIIPDAHRAFLEACDDSVAIGEYLFVHAGIRPGMPIDHQVQRDLRWIRAPFLQSTVDHGCMVVHGHTIHDRVDFRGNRIGIDTGAYRSGVLTALVLSGDRRRIIQTP